MISQIQRDYLLLQRLEGVLSLIYIYIYQDFNEVSSKERTEMSFEDKRFLEIANEAILQDGHYDLKLPFRKNNVSMPNNRQMAEQRLKSLKRKMKRNQQCTQECVAFLNDIFENNCRRGPTG